MRKNQTRIQQAHTVSNHIRGSENSEEMMSKEIWGWLKLSGTWLSQNYQLYDIWYYQKHFEITGETKLGHFLVYPERKNLDTLNTTYSRRASNLVALKRESFVFLGHNFLLVVFEVDHIYLHDFIKNASK